MSTVVRAASHGKRTLLSSTNAITVHRSVARSLSQLRVSAARSPPISYTSGAESHHDIIAYCCQGPKGPASLKAERMKNDGVNLQLLRNDPDHLMSPKSHLRNNTSPGFPVPKSWAFVIDPDYIYSQSCSSDLRCPQVERDALRELRLITDSIGVSFPVSKTRAAGQEWPCADHADAHRQRTSQETNEPKFHCGPSGTASDFEQFRSYVNRDSGLVAKLENALNAIFRDDVKTPVWLVCDVSDNMVFRAPDLKQDLTFPKTVWGRVHGFHRDGAPQSIKTPRKTFKYDMFQAANRRFTETGIELTSEESQCLQRCLEMSTLAADGCAYLNFRERCHDVFGNLISEFAPDCGDLRVRHKIAIRNIWRELFESCKPYLHTLQQVNFWQSLQGILVPDTTGSCSLHKVVGVESLVINGSREQKLGSNKAVLETHRCHTAPSLRVVGATPVLFASTKAHHAAMNLVGDGLVLPRVSLEVRLWGGTVNAYVAMFAKFCHCLGSNFPENIRGSLVAKFQMALESGLKDELSFGDGSA